MACASGSALLHPKFTGNRPWFWTRHTVSLSQIRLPIWSQTIWATSHPSSVKYTSRISARYPRILADCPSTSFLVNGTSQSTTADGTTMAGTTNLPPTHQSTPGATNQFRATAHMNESLACTCGWQGNETSLLYEAVNI